jgi:hypothetical protein
MKKRTEMETPAGTLPCAKCKVKPALSRVELMIGPWFDLTCFTCDYDVSRRSVPLVVEAWNLVQQRPKNPEAR